MIIGLTGLPASGKATVAAYLVNKYNFKQLVFSDIIKSELAKDNIVSPDREDYKIKARDLRQLHGDGALALLLIKQILQTDPKIENNYVLDGVRTMGEVIEIQKVGGKVWAITAPVEKRLAWMNNRNRDIDTKFSLQDLQKLDEKELHSGEKTEGDHTLAQTIKNADVTLVNDKTVEELQIKTEELL
ncbi:MAG: AAA family ATPase [bacterium]|nr:AAA family ATPase [bacterium]